jgi:acyl dehydratase
MAHKVGHLETFKRRFAQEDFNRFADLSGDNNPIHVDPEFSARTYFGKTVAHGMLLYSTICRVLSTQYPGPGVLQIKQEMMFQNPTYTDTEITVKFEVIDVKLDEQRTEIRTVISLPDGKPACDGITLIHLPGWKGGFPGIDEKMGSAGESDARRLKRLEIGQTASAKRTFRAESLAEYSDLTGDTNPLFSDGDYARQAGFRDRIIPGPLLSGMFSGLLGTRLPGRGTNWLKQKLHFPAPAYVGDEISATVEIIRLRPEKDLVNLRGRCTNSNGELVCQAQSLVLVKDLEE